MLLNYKDINNIRPIAANIDAPERLAPYMEEAEHLRIVELLGAALYKWLDTTDFTTGESWTYTTPGGDAVVVTKEQHDILLNGGYYTDDCGNTQYTQGLIAGAAYVAYARFLQNQPINVTAFGVRYKDGEYSSRVDDNTVIRAAGEARKIGEAYLKGVLDYCKALRLIDCRLHVETPCDIIRIGKKRL